MGVGRGGYPMSHLYDCCVQNNNNNTILGPKKQTLSEVLETTQLDSSLMKPAKSNLLKLLFCSQTILDRGYPFVVSCRRCRLFGRFHTRVYCTRCHHHRTPYFINLNPPCYWWRGTVLKCKKQGWWGSGDAKLRWPCLGNCGGV